jgi:glycosyltransferase involved in cell wall biosynthesis
MKISLTTPESNAKTNHGYGVACDGMVQALETLGHEVVVKDPTAPVEIAFSQPDYWDWSNPNAHHIGYVPWESTRVPDRWLAPMKAADELWTTSDWCKRVYEKNGLENIRVYHHGIDAFTWARKRRRPSGRPLRFLHIGEPAPRKGGQMVYDTFKEVFGDSLDATLTIKAHGHNTVRGSEPIEIGSDGNLFIRPSNNSPNVKVITSDMDTFELVDLVQRHDVLLYPSYGEGFGLIPLQAMVTGMPVVCTGVWAPYKDLLIPELVLPSKIIKSPWPEMHPGNVYEPSVDALRAAMMLCADPDLYSAFSARAYFNSFPVEVEFDWLTLTRNAFGHIVEKFS